MPVMDRLMARVHATKDGCWEFKGALRNGYGVIGLGARSEGIGYVHRVAYEHLVGPIPDGMHIDHLCRNRPCCNPEHLQVVTQAENNQRMWDANPRTSCRRGHPYIKDNFRISANKRVCRVCRQERDAKNRSAAA